MLSVFMSSLFLKFNSRNHCLIDRFRVKHSFRVVGIGAEDILMFEAHGRAGCFVSTKDWHELCSGKRLIGKGKGEAPVGRAHFSYYRS